MTLSLGVTPGTLAMPSMQTALRRPRKTSHSHGVAADDWQCPSSALLSICRTPGRNTAPALPCHKPSSYKTFTRISFLHSVCKENKAKNEEPSCQAHCPLSTHDAGKIRQNASSPSNVVVPCYRHCLRGFLLELNILLLNAEQWRLLIR